MAVPWNDETKAQVVEEIRQLLIEHLTQGFDIQGDIPAQQLARGHAIVGVGKLTEMVLTADTPDSVIEAIEALTASETSFGSALIKNLFIESVKLAIRK